MRCAALQTEHRFGDADAALRQVEALLDDAGPLDLVLLGEAALTGYVSPSGDFDLSPQAEPPGGLTHERLAALARRRSVAVAGPLIERDGGACFNSFVVLDARGDRVARYRKRHPWLPETWATPGDNPYARFSVAGCSLLLAVCYDVHFLDEEASDALRAVDALLFPSAWVNGRQRPDTREFLLPRLARRHGVWVVNANWALSRPRVPGQGGSMIVDPSGQIAAVAPHAGPCAVVAEIARRG